MRGRFRDFVASKMARVISSPGVKWKEQNPITIPRDRISTLRNALPTDEN